MEDKLLDPTLIGVIIGSALSLAVSIFTQYFSNRKEERQWERQRIASREEREEIKELKESEHVRDVYHKCLLSLSVFMTAVQQKDEEDHDNRCASEIKEVHHWLSLLLLRHPHKKLSGLLDSFLYEPDENDAERLRGYVLELIQREQTLDSPGRITEALTTKEERTTMERTVSFKINEDYRRQSMISGVELPQNHSCVYQFGDLTEQQRERLLQVYFQSYRRIPDNAQLYLPVLRAGQRQIDRQGKPWEARIDPASSSLCELLDAWVRDFDEHLENAEQSLAANA